MVDNILKVFPCKKCRHNYEDHIEGGQCSYCYADSQANDNMDCCVCDKFEMNNLAYLEAKYESRNERRLQ